jgi:hypothetical protein
MEDSRLVENLIYTYAERIDAGDLEGVAELFRYGEIAAPTEGSLVQGYDAVLGMYQQATRLYEDTGTPKTRHITTNVIIELNGETAESRSCFTVVQGTQDFPLQPIISGRYQDTFNKLDGQWWFGRREMHVDLVGDLSAHLLIEL